jgi:hypothetical protein
MGLLLLSALVACGGNPPQIVDYSPERGAKDVSTAAPIRITFDHAVDKGSVESRLSLQPTTPTTVQWANPRQLLLQHATLQANTTYDVVLEAGYKDLSGNAYSLRHHWSFMTELAPALTAAQPGDKEGGVDPATFLTLDFSREMNAASLPGAITISPPAPFNVRLDPADGRRAIVAPQSLLSPTTQYTVTVSSSALDVDGNQLDRDRTLTFTTGPARPLRHWIGFATRRLDGTLNGVWIVNENSFPRQLFLDQAIDSFSWSPDGALLLVQTGPQSWAALTPGADSVRLGFFGVWAAALSPACGYVYLDSHGALHRWSAEGIDDVIATGVSSASVAPDGLRVAYVTTRGNASVIWGYDVGLKASYQLAAEDVPITYAAWSPAANRIAYLRQDAGTTTLRVRSLTGQATTTTIVSGDLGRPAWLPDSTQVVFASVIQSPTGPVRRAFLVSVVAPSPALTVDVALPQGSVLDISDPVPSPDGHQIAFLSGDQVWIMNADGTRPTRLTKFDTASFPYSCEALMWTRA